MSGYYTFGAVNTGTTTNNFFALAEDLSTEEFSGFYITDYCIKEINKYQLLYYDFKYNGWAPALANSMNTLPAKGIALESAIATSKLKILLYGGLYNSKWNFNTSKYKFVWVSQYSLGNMSLSPLDYINYYRQPVGIITSSHQIFFNFYQLWFCNIDEGFK